VHEERNDGDDEHHHHGQAVDRDPDADVDATVLEPGDAPGHGLDRGVLLAARDETPAEGGEAAGVLFSTACAERVLHPVDPLPRRDAGHHERRAHCGDAELGALLRQPLPEQEDADERQRGEQRDEPGVSQHVSVSP